MDRFNNTYNNDNDKNGGFNMDDIIDNYEHGEKTSNLKTNDQIWSEPLSDDTTRFSSGFNMGPQKPDNDKAKHINLNLDDGLEDTPDSYVRNNQTIKLNQADNRNDSNFRQQGNNNPYVNYPNQSNRSGYNNAQSNNNYNNQPNNYPNQGYGPNINQSINNQNQVNRPNNNQYVNPNQGYNQNNNYNEPRQSQSNFVQNNVPNAPIREVPIANLDRTNNNFNGYQNQANNNPKANGQGNVTKILFNENLNRPTEDLTREINDAENITFGAKQNVQKVKQPKIDKFKDVPKFFRFEYRHSLIGLFLAILFFVAILGGLGYQLAETLNNNLSYWLFLPTGLIGLFGLCHYISSQMKFNMLRKDFKSHNYKIEKEIPLTSVRKVYQRLVTANITLNWVSGTIYLVAALGILLTYVITYFINMGNFYVNDFTHLVLGPDNYLPVYFVWTFVGVACFTVLVEFVYNFLNRKRRNDMELFYEKPIISDELVAKYRKQANFRGMIIFLTTSVVAGLVVLIVYLVLRRKKA